MPKFVPITKTHFAEKQWQRVTNYTHAANDTICPLVVQELPKVQLSLPIAFAYINEQPTLVAVQGIKPNKNILVDNSGKWIGKDIPAAYRGYPFLLANTEDGQQVLCFDEESGLLTEKDDEAFFGEDGEVAEAVKGVMTFLTNVQNNRTSTLNICTVLHDNNLIQPWPIKLKTDDGEVPVEGLFRIDEAALNALDKDVFEDIRQAGALPLIYCQLLSMQHLPALANLAAQVDKVEQQQTDVVLDLDKLFGESDDLFKF